MQPALPFEAPSPRPGAVHTAAGRPMPPAPVVPAPRTTQFAPDLIRHPRARRYVVRVRPDGSVRVTIPRWGTKREAMAFAERQRAWIDKQRARLESERARPREELSAEQAGALRLRAKRELPARLLELAKSFGLAVSRISIRNQRWRWGSCSRRGHICLHWRLVVMPEWVRDYVLVHELMHLKRLDHSPKFWKLVAAACPRYQEARAWLRTYQKDGHAISASNGS